MPGTTGPQHGVQGLWAPINEIRARISNLEIWQRQTRGIPPGTITQWGGPTAPTGALLCDGSTFSAGTYPLLAAVLGGTTLPTITTTPITVIWT